jgi:hypothetical protein
MARGTFANIRLLNKFLNKQAPQTIHLPSGEIVSIASSASFKSQYFSGPRRLGVYTLTFLLVLFFFFTAPSYPWLLVIPLASCLYV